MHGKNWGTARSPCRARQAPLAATLPSQARIRVARRFALARQWAATAGGMRIDAVDAKTWHPLRTIASFRPLDQLQCTNSY